MNVCIEDFINLLAEFCELRDLKVAISESVKGGLVTGCSAVLGGLLLGPLGLAIGGALGGGVAAVSAKGKFKPVAIILTELTPSQKKKLYDRARTAFRNFKIEDAAALSLLLLSNSSFQEVALRALTSFLQGEMNLKLQ